MDIFRAFLDVPLLTAFVSVVLIDVALAGDNAIAVGMAASGLAPRLRQRAIVFGIAAAAALRISFAWFTVELLQIIGLLLAGGLLLLWVSWRLWRELRTGEEEDLEEREAEAALLDEETAALPGKSFRAAVAQIIAADVSMSLDNVLAVAGAAREHPTVLVFGLALSVVLMGVAASLIAHVIRRHRWIAYLGLAIIVFVALRMIWDGTQEVLVALQPG